MVSLLGGNLDQAFARGSVLDSFSYGEHRFSWLSQRSIHSSVTAGIVQKNLSQSLSTCYIFIDLVNIIPHKVTVLNCLCFLS